ncbi:MAG: hypothetical protein JKY88_06205 [Pseudomonadales bacterium]|nr:hypothetical protein [Pseudomonadales bacterium]
MNRDIFFKHFIMGLIASSFILAVCGVIFRIFLDLTMFQLIIGITHTETNENIGILVVFFSTLSYCLGVDTGIHEGKEMMRMDDK